MCSNPFPWTSQAQAVFVHLFNGVKIYTINNFISLRSFPLFAHHLTSKLVSLLIYLSHFHGLRIRILGSCFFFLFFRFEHEKQQFVAFKLINFIKVKNTILIQSFGQRVLFSCEVFQHFSIHKIIIEHRKR